MNDKQQRVSRIKAPTTIIKKVEVSASTSIKEKDSSLMAATPKKHTSRNFTNDSSSHCKTERQSLSTSKLMIEPFAQTPKKQIITAIHTPPLKKQKAINTPKKQQTAIIKQMLISKLAPILEQKMSVVMEQKMAVVKVVKKELELKQVKKEPELKLLKKEPELKYQSRIGKGVTTNSLKQQPTPSRNSDILNKITITAFKKSTIIQTFREPVAISPIKIDILSNTTTTFKKSVVIKTLKEQPLAMSPLKSTRQSVTILKEPLAIISSPLKTSRRGSVLNVSLSGIGKGSLVSKQLKSPSASNKAIMSNTDANKSREQPQKQSDTTKKSSVNFGVRRYSQLIKPSEKVVLRVIEKVIKTDQSQKDLTLVTTVVHEQDQDLSPFEIAEDLPIEQDLIVIIEQPIQPIIESSMVEEEEQEEESKSDNNMSKELHQESNPEQQYRESIIKQVNHQSNSSISTRTNLLTSIEKAQLSDTIKSLEKNLATLPSGFNRQSKLRDKLKTLPQIQIKAEVIQIQEERNPFIEERNLPLRAFLPVQQQQPVEKEEDKMQILDCEEDEDLLLVPVKIISNQASRIKPPSQPTSERISITAQFKQKNKVSHNKTVKQPLKVLQQPPRVAKVLTAKKAFQHLRFSRDSSNIGNDTRNECQHCCRRFNDIAIVKHLSICEKVFIRKRKQFNSLAQRALDETHLKFIEIAQLKYSYYHDNQKLNPLWKQRSDNFRQQVKLARNGNSEMMLTGDNRIECKKCGKRFAPATAERHIPLCKKNNKMINVYRK